MDKKLNLFDLISIGVGCIVGSGIFALLGPGIAYAGRGITVALFLAMGLCVLQSVALLLLTRIFELDGGEYAINSLVCPPMASGFAVGRDILFRAGSLAVTAIAITQYLERLLPGITSYAKLVDILVLTAAFACVVVGDKFASKVQNTMCIFMYIALGLFVIYGFLNISGCVPGRPASAQRSAGADYGHCADVLHLQWFSVCGEYGKISGQPEKEYSFGILPFRLCRSSSLCSYWFCGHPYPIV